MYTHIHSSLWELNNSCLEIKASVFASTDGLIMAAALPESMNEDHVAAISAGAIVLGTHTSKEFASGSLEQVLIKCKSNCLVVTRAGEECILTVMTHPHIDLDAMFSRLKYWAEKISMTI